MNNDIIKYENGIDFEVADKPANPDQFPSHENTISFNEIKPSYIFQIRNENLEALVTVGLDGTITYGDNYHPDDAAKIFWKALGNYAPKSNDTAVESLENMVAIQCSDGNWDYNEYMYGMANGMVLALATLKGEDPIYFDRPKEWLEDKCKNATVNSVSELAWQDAIDYLAEDLRKAVDEDVLSNITEEAQQLTADDYERAMKGL